MHSKVGSKCPLVLINNVPEEDGQATGLVHANASYLHRLDISPSWLASLSMTYLVAVVVAASSYETGRRCAVRLCPKDDHSSVH